MLKAGEIGTARHEPARTTVSAFVCSTFVVGVCTLYSCQSTFKAALKAGLEIYSVLSSTGVHISDGASLMFTNEPLNDALKTHDNTLKVPLEDLLSRSPEVHRYIRMVNVKNVVIEVSECKSFNIKNISGMLNVDRTQTDQSVKQFFEIITSEFAIENQTYNSFTGGKLFRIRPDGNYDFPSAGFGQERRPGIFKGFTLAKKKDEVIAALNIDVTTGTFWCAGSLEGAIMKINGWERPQHVRWDAQAVNDTKKFIKGLRVSYTQPGGKSFDFLINDITATTDGASRVRVVTIEQQMCKDPAGNEEPVKNKFSNINLRLGNWPLVVVKRARRRADDPKMYDETLDYFPVELLQVKANQRVPLSKQGSELARPIRVDDRWNRTRRDLEALNLFGETRGPTANSIVEAFGIRVIRKPLTTKAITRKMPTVTFNQPRKYNEQTLYKANTFVNEKTKFFTSDVAYDTPAHISTLCIAYSTDRLPTGFNKEKFASTLVGAAKTKNMRIDSCVWDVVQPKDLFKQMKDFKSQRDSGDLKWQRIVLMYIEPAASYTHDELKLFERYCCITTQHLKLENAVLLLSNRMMMENVLLKLNIKGGGHNYIVKPEIFAERLWMDKQTMIMGYDVCHPTGQSRAERMADRLPDPSVVGFSFNGGVSPDSFIGDYHFQQATKERVNDDVLIARIKWMLGTFERSRGVLPPLIIIIRDGISDGQYQHGMDELDALRQGAREYAVSTHRSDTTGKSPVPDYSPDFIFVVATKRHHKRMYTEGLGNLPAMSVVDDTITNPVLFEFFLQSHTPIQGMAKATKYTVLKDDLGTTSDAMQSLMGALCFEHQVSNNAISIPEPVYQSDEWAKRGAANMRMYKLHWGEQGQFKKDVTYEKLTSILSYWNSPLERVRVNA